MRDENQVTTQNDEQSHDPAAEQPAQDGSGNEGEFRLTIKKLEMPVRPRGVLAE